MQKELIRLLIYGYRSLSPLLGTTTCCKFEVSCSEYALQSFMTQPFWQACWLTGKRILSC